jgi:hypothetical protein
LSPRSKIGEDVTETLEAGFAGLMQADAYAGFNRLYEAERKPAPIIEVGCWAHARRKFFDLARINRAPIASEAVTRIDALFAIEREIKGSEALRLDGDAPEPADVPVPHSRPMLGDPALPRDASTPFGGALHRQRQLVHQRAPGRV